MIAISVLLVVFYFYLDYATCLSVASKFATTVSNGPVANITATAGINVSCSQLNATFCPGSIINGICVWQRKLVVTCINNSTVRIRVQSNGLPGRCMNSPMDRPRELNIDFEVNFNPKVSVNSPNHSPTTQSELNNIICNISNQQSVPSTSNFVTTSAAELMQVLAGVSIDNVAILNVNSANNADPFYPPAGSTAESVDECLGHPNVGGIYHYHIASGCAVSPPTGNISTCNALSACSNNIASYFLTTFPSSARTLTVIGIAKDGHVIYGPYSSSGKIFTSGFDICNGMFYNLLGDYAYFATNKYPYITGCFGPGNYPSFGSNCTTNGQTSYSKSIYATAFSNGK